MPKTGTWTISYSLRSGVYGNKYSYAYLYHNEEQIPETVHITYANDAFVWSTSGREILMRAEQGDTLTLRSGGMYLPDGFKNIMTCFEFNDA